MRVATFNLENLDFSEDFEKRREVLVPQLERLDSDILLLQEIHSQKDEEGDRSLVALTELIKGTKYESFNISSTLDENYELYAQRNLVILANLDILDTQQFKHVLSNAPKYQVITADPNSEEPEEITWERPILYSKIKLKEDKVAHVINLHLKSKNPTNIQGQKFDRFSWKSSSGWAEGYFLSAMRRVGQAVEVRMLVDKIFDEEEDPIIIVGGDFNADLYEVPFEAIVGRTENTGNITLQNRELVPCELSVPDSARFSLYHHGKKNMLDHILVSRSLLPYYEGTEIHNETLSDESIAFATDDKYPESDHAPILAKFKI